MKKQIKFKIYLLINLLFFIISCTSPSINIKCTLVALEQDTLKNYNQQVQKLNEIKQKIDSTQLKWNAIEKTLKEKQQQQPK